MEAGCLATAEDLGKWQDHFSRSSKAGFFFKELLTRPHWLVCVAALNWASLEVRAIGGRLAATCAVGRATGTRGTFSSPSREGKEGSPEDVGTQPHSPPSFCVAPPRLPTSGHEGVWGLFLPFSFLQDTMSSPDPAPSSPLRILCCFSFLI